MDEQRMQAYVALIEQLLGCPQGQETALLQAHEELVDAGLLEAMEQVAAYLESQGNSNAGRLRGFVTQLAQVLGIETEQETAAAETETAAQFLIQTLKLVATSKGNPQQVYAVWAQQQGQINVVMLEALPQVAAQLFAGDTEKRTYFAAVLVTFGNLINQFPLGTRWLNLELGIASYQQSLKVMTQAVMPVEWTTTMNNLAIAYTDRIRGDKADNIDAAIEAYQQVLKVVTQAAMPVEWAITMHNLATVYRNRTRGDKADNIDAAIEAYQQSLTVITQTVMPDKWALAMMNLAIAYRNRIRGDKAENIEAAIAACQQALTVRTQATMPIEWAQTLNNLGNAYVDRIQGNKAENIEAAIEAFQQALTVSTQAAMPIDWATTMMNLATAYLYRIRGDRAENIEVAISVYQQALKVRTQATMPIEWAQTLSNLANAYVDRIRGDKAENIEAAITICQQVLTVSTQESMPVEWAQTLNNLGNAYVDRIQGNKAENIEAAIEAFQQALTVRTQATMPIDWATTMMNLATAYRYRIQGDRAENIEAAISAYHQVLTVRTQATMPIEWAQALNNLANAYSNRIRGDKAENIEAAIEAFQQALTVMTEAAMPVDWATTLVNLAIAYVNRIRGDKAENIEAAIEAFQQALTVMTEAAMPVDWATTTLNLATAYANRIRGDKAENIEAAIAACHQALKVMTQAAMPLDWASIMNNLATAYSNRIRGGKAENIEAAIAAYQSSLEIFTPEALPNDCRRSASSLGNLYSKQHQWQEAVVIYQKALQASESLYQSANLLDSKAAQLTETANLPRRAAYALARIGDLPAAALTLEQGRARGLSESLDRDRADLTQLQQLAPALFDQYQAITAQLRNLENQQRQHMTSGDRHSLTPKDLRDAAIALRQQLNTLLQAIRQQPGYEKFLSLPTLAEIQAAIQRDHPLIYLVTTPTGSLALILTLERIESVWLDALNETQLIDLLRSWFTAYGQFQSDQQGWYDAIDSITHQLWEPVMQPIIQHLKDHQFHQATLIPTGYLSLLPLHAAWIEDPSTPTGKRYALDDIHITYVPNAKSLTAAHAIVDRVQTDSILAIDNPSLDLDNSEREVQAAIASFLPQATTLRHHRATTTAVKTALPQSAIAHFSCHGTANLNEPLTSGLALSDGLLTLKDIFALNLAESGGLRLAILSACETGIQGLENADEAVSLPTGLLQAGVAAVISSLWSVDDRSTMLLLTRFYDLWRIEGREIDQALRQAQQWIRDTTNIQKYNYLKDAMQKLVDAQQISLQESNNVLREFMVQYVYTDEPQGQSFAHPFHWAALTYVGV
jgi:CHAT domain-containing protein/peptidoglycan hydrolase-like protein with peptidoglycan-binding domain